MTELLSIQNLSKTFDNEVVALQDVDLSIIENEITTLLGASGCGKSTLLQIVAGLMSPSMGQLDWKEPPRRGDIGFVFQDATLLPWATVSANVGLPLSLLGVDETDASRRIGEVLELVGLQEFSGAYPRELSGGMKMRVSLARALVSRPKILLMDEPFAALDEITRSKLNRELLEICAIRPVTVLFVTHSVLESVFLSERVIVMKPRPGRVHELVTLYHTEERNYQYRLSSAFTKRARQISESLLESMEGGA